MNDIPVRPHRKTLRQTGIILNVHVKTVRRYLNKGWLEWSGKQVLMASIEEFLDSSPEGEGFDAPEKADQISAKKARRQFSKGVG